MNQNSDAAQVVKALEQAKGLLNRCTPIVLEGQHGQLMLGLMKVAKDVAAGKVDAAVTKLRDSRTRQNPFMLLAALRAPWASASWN